MAEYRKIHHIFINDEILKNDNGYEYIVLDATYQNAVIMQNIKTGEKVLAKYPSMFEKIKDTEISIVLSWDAGDYYRSTTDNGTIINNYLYK